jgi:stigma-specific protein Stig1
MPRQRDRWRLARAIRSGAFFSLAVACNSREGRPSASAGVTPAASETVDVALVAPSEGRTPEASTADSKVAEAFTGACEPPRTLCGKACVDVRTDRANCGHCVGWCSGRCDEGECVPSAAPTAPACLGSPGCLVELAYDVVPKIVVDADTVYLGSLRGLRAMPKTTPGVSKRLAAFSTSRVDLAVDDTNVYWTTDAPQGSVKKMPKRGGPISTLDSASADRIAVDQGYVYWANTDSVMRAPVAGGPTTTVAAGQRDLDFIAVSGPYLYWSLNGPHGSVLRASVQGGAVATIARDQAHVSGLFADPRGVYWTTEGVPLGGENGTVVSLGVAGGAPVTLASRQKTCWGIAVDATSVYWSTTDRSNMDRARDRDLSSVLAVPIAGGRVVTLADEQAVLWTFAVDDKTFYWVNQATGKSGRGSPGIMALQLR